MTSALTVPGALALVATSLLFAAIPGPGVAAVIGQALARGRAHAMLWGAGIVLGDLFYLLLAMLGMGFVAQQLGWAFGLLKWCGAAYLVYLGLRAFRTSNLPPPPPGQPKTAERAGLARTFLGGFCVSLGNPKVIAFYCGFLPGFVDLRALSGLDMLLVVALIIPTVYSVVAAYACLAARGRRAMGSGRLWKYANRGAGAAMIGAGVAVAAN